MKNITSLIAGTLFLVLGPVAHAGIITSAASATASSEFGPAYDIGNTIDQSGLSSGYVSGVTDFATYIGTNPMHTFIASDMEWFSSVPAATVVYDMGSALSLMNLALWNEEFSGFGQAVVTSSLDNVTFSALTTINPIDTPSDADYGAQIFALGVTAQFLKFELTGCPQPNGNAALYCGIGEVAFDVGSSAVPAPATLALFGLGLAGLGFLRRRKA